MYSQERPLQIAATLIMSNVWSWKVDKSITWFASEKEAGHFFIFYHPDWATHSPTTSNQAIGSNHTKSVNADNHSTSEILPAKAAAIEVETEPTSEHHNAALKLPQFLPF